MSKIYDVVILGAGPAGLAAGLYAGRARMSVLIVEKGKDGGQYPGGHRLLHPLQAGQTGAVVLPLGHLLQVPLHDLRGGGGHLPPCVHP